MASFTYPGVYIEELSSGQHTITGVATSIGAFCGWAPQGPVTEAVLVQSWSDYVAAFGGLDSRSWLGYAVNQFFANGGSQTYIVRLAWNSGLQGGVNSPVDCATATADGVGYGTATITATSGGVTGSITLGVGAPALQSITVLPQGVPVASAASLQLPPLPSGATLALTATGQSSDGSSAALTTANWVTSDSAILKVSPAGVVTAGVVTKPSTATITAVDPTGIVSGSIAISVTAATISSIAITPASVTAVAGQTVQLAAAAFYSDGTSPDITSIATFSSSAPAVATFSTAAIPLAPGQLKALTTGTANYGAKLPSYFGGITLAAPAVSPSIKVNAAALTAIAISPANATVPILSDIEKVGTEQEVELPTFSLSATYSDGTTTPVPGVTWASSNPAVAQVDLNSGALTVVGPGTATITATPTAPGATITATTTLTVLSGHFTTLSITPQTLVLAAGRSQQLTATGTFDDGTFVDMTGYATWSITAGASATINAATGVITAAAGITVNEAVTVQAAWLELTATATLTMTLPVTESIAITTVPAGTTSLTPGQNLSLVATATMSDTSTTNPPVDVTATAVWASANTSLATIAGPGVVAAAAAGGSLTLFAINPGLWGNSLRVSTTALPNNKFNLLVQMLTSTGALATLESYVNLSVLPTDPNYAVTVINNDSAYITFTNPATAANVVPTATPTTTTAPVAFTGGADGTVLIPNDGNFEIALAASINLLDSVAFNILCVPGETTASTISNLESYCFLQRAFMIVDSPQNTTISNLMTSGPVGSTPGSITEQYGSNAAYYFPWVQAPDPLVGNRPALFPPCGFVAGIYAATDSSRGVWKAPAGINAGLTGNSGLQFVLTDDQNGTLNPQAVNCLRQFKVYGDVVWGARTLVGSDQAGSQWKYVPIRRLALYLESSLFDGTQWVVFEPNDETLWGQVRLNVGTFLQGLFLQGAFAGATPQQAYFVKCDGENNPPSSIALGVVNILVGFAPLYPAEFVVIEIQQIIAQAS
jgi:phage tail sheath protein FI